MNKKNLLKLFPDRVRLRIIGLYLARKRRTVGLLDSPSALTFFVTRRCNLKCAHCFYWKEINDQNNQELTLVEIKKILPTLKKKFSLALTGGEPFLRKDLVDICSVFLEGGRVTEIGIATNGYLTDKIVFDCKQILKISRVPISIQVSLDGCEKTHDRIRGVIGSFRKAWQTLQMLKQLQSNLPGKLGLSIAFAVQKENIAEAEGFIELVLPLRVPIRFLITRGESFGLFNMPECLSSRIDPREKGSAEIPVADLEKAFKMIEQKNRTGPFRFWEIKQPEIIGLSLKILKERRKQIPCYAGAIEGILYDNGDLALCEFMHPIGNLKDWQYDLYRLWNSERANEMRKTVEKCFCIHSCSLGTSLHLHSPEMVNKVLRKNG